MANLIINANNISGAVSVLVRYRLLNSGNTYNELVLQASQLPYTIQGVQSGQYEVGVANVCSNGSQSAWVVGQTNACASVVSFAAILSGANFQINATLAGTQTKIQVQVTDPNGGIQNYTGDFGSSQTGTFNIPVTSGLYGNYSFIASGICDSTSIPIFQSAYSSPPIIVAVNQSANSFTVRMSTSSGTVCAATPGPVYSISTPIAPGVIVYFDSGLTLPVNTMDFIADPSGVIYSISNLGVVGAATGSTC